MSVERFYYLRYLGATVRVRCGSVCVFYLDLSDDCYTGFSIVFGNIVRFWCNGMLCLISLNCFEEIEVL